MKGVSLVNRYKIVTPHSIEQALESLKNDGRMKILAGGTDLVVQMKEGLLGEVDILDISKIEELRSIEEKENGIQIGVLCTLSQISENAEITTRLPCLAQAASSVGAVQIRNKATIGGNIMNASPAADTVPALIALGAKALIRSGCKSRELPIEEVFLSPGRTALRDDELLTGLFIPKQPMRSAATFGKLGRRKAQAISVANLAVRILLDEKKERFIEARVALGSVAPTVVRIQSAEGFLKGCEINKNSIEKSAEIVAEGINPITDIRASDTYRRKVSRALFIKAIYESLEQLGVNIPE